VRFSFSPPGFFTGLRVTIVALTVLLIGTAAAAYVSRRASLR